MATPSQSVASSNSNPIAYSLTNPYVVLIVSLLAGSFAAVFMRLALDNGIPPALVIAGRLGIAALLLTPVVLARYWHEVKGMSRTQILYALAAGGWMGVHFLLVIVSLRHTTVLNNQVLVNTLPIWSALMEMIFLKTRLHRTVWMGLVIALSGSAVLALFGKGGFSLQGENLFGSVLALAGAVTGAAYLVIGRKARQKVSMIPYVWMVFGTGALVACGAMLLDHTPVFGHPTMGYVWVIMAAVIAQLLSHSGFNYVLAYLPATLIGLNGQIITVLSGFIAFLLFAEAPVPAQLLGSVIITAGVLLATFGRNIKRKRRVSPPVTLQ